MRATEFLSCCRALPDGFITLGTGQSWRLGAVAFVRSGENFAVVQKAARTSYEFSDLWALPGGMVRLPKGDEPSIDRLEGAVRSRINQEAGLILNELDPVALGPIVTTYVAKGRSRTTLVAVFAGQTSHPETLTANDSTIQTVAWSSALATPALFAPANQLILAHLLWFALSDEARLQMKVDLQPALHACTEAAECAGIVAPELPWAEENALECWRNAWPEI